MSRETIVKRLIRIGCGIANALSAATLLLVSVVACAGLAGATPFEDKPLTYWFKDDSGQVVKFSFPFIEAENEVVAKRINNFLHLTVLDMAPPANSMVGPIQATSDFSKNIGFMTSRGIKRINGGRVLNVGYINRGTGSHIEITNSYQFDSRTGRLLLREELLIPRGTTLLAKRLVKQRQSRINKEIAQLTKSLKTSNNKKFRSDAPELINEKIDLYERCLEEHFEGSALKYALDDPGIMNVEDRSLVFVSGPCSNQSIDDLMEFKNKLSAEEAKPFLSSYGRYILFGEGDGAIAAINPYSQIFRGKINSTIPITLYLGSDFPLMGDTQVKNAKYYYDKYRTVIHLSVAKKGDSFELTETDSKEIPKPILSFKIKDDKLVGQWRGGGKTYSFEAAP